MSNLSDLDTVKTWVKVAILLVGAWMVSLLSLHHTGSLIPKDPEAAIIYTSALLVIILGSTLVETKFTHPTDATVNALMAIVALLPLAPERQFWWYGILLYCVAVLITALICIITSTSPQIQGVQKIVANGSYRISKVFGKSRVLFSVVFLFGVANYYEFKDQRAFEIVAFWGFMLALSPLRIPALLSKIGFGTLQDVKKSMGSVFKREEPNIVRVALAPQIKWKHDDPKLLRLSGGTFRLIIPLYSYFQGEQLIGTGITAPISYKSSAKYDADKIYELPSDLNVDLEKTFKDFGGGQGSRLIGFVSENSSIQSINFEVLGPLEEGTVVSCAVQQNTVYYQVTSGVTEEESLSIDRHGFQIANAAQLGKLENRPYFEKFGWLPQMNQPVFTAPNIELPVPLPQHDFKLGEMPGSNLPVLCSLVENLEYHTALLGVTGSGKTQLAYDLIKHTISKNTKVICIDLTAQYSQDLSDLHPEFLSVESNTAQEIETKIFEAETGAYGGGAEKRILKEFLRRIEEQTKQQLADFLKSDHKLGIIELQEISNTAATLTITEQYISNLLRYKKENPNGEKLLLVVEEAQTVMPESTNVGLGSFDAKAMVTRIAQIALQGRKYGIGLLVISQRTANVSKSILTQCNSVISFASYDETNINFLSHIFGKQYASVIPNLGFLQAVAFGKSINSERPVIVQIPKKEPLVSFL
ncbi:MAG: DUF87 domain-containing protein [bacterium]|nr:DUF87 domain-containing protein [bacterium]